MINAINDIIFPILLFLLIYSFLWEFVPDFPASELTDPTPAIKEAFSAASDPEPVAVTPEPVLEALPETVAEEKVSPEPHRVCPVESLPSTIRTLRQYIRESNLQELIKQRTGKTVSQCVKEELIAALAT